MLIIRKFYLPLILTVSLLFINGVAPTDSLSITQYYTHNFYTSLNWMLNCFTNVFHFSIGDVFYATIILLLLFLTIKYLKNKQFLKLAICYLNSILLFMLSFQLFWGLNNYKLSMTSELDLEVNYTKSDLDYTTEKLIEVVNKQHSALTTTDSISIKIKRDLGFYNRIAKTNYEKLPVHLKSILITNTINNVKPSMYSSVLSYTGFSGYFNPFTHENQINVEIPTIGMPITVAHEMAHQLGIASEAEANFYGYQVMALSEDVTYQYAANLYALKYCLKEYRKENEETYQLLFAKLNLGVQKNILESEAFWQSKRTVSSFFFKHLYGRFLKINNQKDGIKSYNRFVDLLINYNKKYKSF